MLTFQVFAHPTGLASGYTDVLVLQDSLLPLTTSCCPPTTSCYLPRLPATSHDFLLPHTFLFIWKISIPKTLEEQAAWSLRMGMKEGGEGACMAAQGITGK
jgi:hypothetical protein